MKIILTVVVIVLCNLVWILFKKNTTMGEIHILPKGFKGVVMIIHDQEKGTEFSKENGNIVYRIPTNGILITKAPLTEGLKDIKYYYEENSSRQEIKYCWDCKKSFPNNDTVYVFGGSTGTYGEGNEKVDCTTYLVCTQQETDSLSRVLEEIRPLEILKQY
ncbi:MAG: DUF6843 domain-containing protein [Flavobacteriales bacterium]